MVEWNYNALYFSSIQYMHSKKTICEKYAKTDIFTLKKKSKSKAFC